MTVAGAELQRTQGGDSAKKDKISIAFSLENFDFRRVFQENEDKLGFEVEVARINNTDMKVEVLTRIDSRSLPDAVIMPADMLGLSKAQFSTIPMDWLSNDIPESSRDLAKVNGEIKGIPIIAGNHLVLYYNKKYISQPATSWQDLIRQQKELSNVELIGWPYNEAFWILPFLSAFDALPYVNGEIRLDQAGTQEAFQFLARLKQQNLVDATCNYDCTQGKFLSGRLAYTINGSWAFGNFVDELGGDLGVTTLPSIDGKVMRPYKSAHVLAFPNNGVSGNKQQQLRRLAALLQSQQLQRQLWEEKRALPTNVKTLNDVLDDSNKNIKQFIEQLSTSEPMPNDEVMAIVWEAIIIGFNRFDGNAMSISQTTSYMQYIAEKSKDEIE